MKIAIIGIGSMGSLFAKQLSDHDIYVYDKDEERLKTLDANIITLDKLKDMDLVIVAVPLDLTNQVIEDIAKYMKKGAWLLEIASIKSNTYNILRKVTKRYDIKVSSIHPLFGKGIRTLKGAKIIFIPVIDEDNEYQFINNLFPNARIIKMDYREHDKIMAIVLGLTHLTNFIMAKILADEDYDRLKEIGGTTFRLQTILLESIMNDPPSLSISLMLNNPYMKRYTKKYKKIVDELSEDIINNDHSIFNSYKRTRNKLSSLTNLDESYKLMYDILEVINKS
jgi:prephenate dehydrogenase